MEEAAIRIVHDAWDDYGASDPIVSMVETSPGVSTNRVYHVRFESGRSLFAKVSSYGSYVHFRQDHMRIQQWCEGLRGTRFEQLLANVLCRNGEVYTFRDRDRGSWVGFYEEA